jgi:hypothetical protein
MIEPTVGRIVWYHPDEVDVAPLIIKGDEIATPMMVSVSGQPFMAQVVCVRESGKVNLLVTDHLAQTHKRLDVTLVQDEDTTPMFGAWCEWMPYQKGQAAATAAVESVLAKAIEPKPVEPGRLRGAK